MQEEESEVPYGVEEPSEVKPKIEEQPIKKNSLLKRTIIIIVVAILLIASAYIIFFY